MIWAVAKVAVTQQRTASCAYMLRIKCGKALILDVPIPVVGSAPLFFEVQVPAGTKGVYYFSRPDVTHLVFMVEERLGG